MNAFPPTLAEFQHAASLLRNVIQPIPLVPLHRYQGDSDILLKTEIHQPVHSFKIRGVWHAVLRPLLVAVHAHLLPTDALRLNALLLCSGRTTGATSKAQLGVWNSVGLLASGLKLHLGF